MLKTNSLPGRFFTYQGESQKHNIVAMRTKTLSVHTRSYIS